MKKPVLCASSLVFVLLLTFCYIIDNPDRLVYASGLDFHKGPVCSSGDAYECSA